MERVKAARGTSLRCRGWRQEAVLRMLENNLENAEKPDELIIYGGTGKAARNWESFHRIVEVLHTLGDDETLIIQSGKRYSTGFDREPESALVLWEWDRATPLL